jgi:hypothetical protein
MKISTLGLSASIVLLTSAPLLADVKVQFFEGAPKDRFVITNTGKCDLAAGQLGIDFSTSNCGLVFDVTGSGAGVEVFQPFEVTAGEEHLVVQPSISDGDQVAMLDMSGLGVSETIAFTIDVDDTNGSREITVANSEISGTTISLSLGDKTYFAKIGAQSEVLLSTPTCDV